MYIMKMRNGREVNITSVMERAWEIYRLADKGDGLKPVFGICLKMSWAEVEMSYSSVDSKSVINEWESLGGDEQCKICRDGVRIAAKIMLRYSVEDRYIQRAEVPAFSLDKYEIEELANSTWISVCEMLEKLTEINRKRARSYKKNMTLNLVVLAAARKTIRTAYISDIRGGRYAIHTVSGSDGEEVHAIDIIADRTQNVYASVEVRDILGGYYNTLDELGKHVLKCMLESQTERRTAQLWEEHISKCGRSDLSPVSNVAVHKRMAGMRSTLKNLFAI